MSCNCKCDCVKLLDKELKLVLVKLAEARLALNEAKHIAGESCDDEKCQECCEKAGHEYDSSEGGQCISCDKEYPV
jgi:hypothetical protein